MNISKRTFGLTILIISLFVACHYNETPPVVAAQQFAADLGLKLIGKPSCAAVDTDNDGYVTCTLRLADDKLLSIQCADITAQPFSCDAHTTRYAVGCKETVRQFQQ